MNTVISICVPEDQRISGPVKWLWMSDWR